MKKYLYLLIYIVCCLPIYSQEIKVKEFKRINGEASAQFPKDNNDVPAALVKVYLEGDVRITGSVIGEIKKINSSYHVYLANGSKRITVVKKGLLPITCVFNDFGINHVQSGNTYQLTLKEETASNEVSGSINGHDYVDLGLSVMWATCNVGANNIEDIGDFYRWAETEVYDENRPYKHYVYNEIGMLIKNTYENIKQMKEKDDVARVKWKGSWRMPTMKEWNELIHNCKETPAVRNGIRGLLFIAENGNKLFVPFVGPTPSFLSGGRYWSTDIGKRFLACGDGNENNAFAFIRFLEEMKYSDLVYEFGDFCDYEYYNDTPMLIRPVSSEPKSKDLFSWQDYYSSKEDGIYNGYGYVNLGLSVLWATCNFEAGFPYEFGTRIDDDEIIKKNIANEKMGKYWSIPSEDEFEELKTCCSWKWTDNYMSSGVSGFLVISEVPGYTNKFVFLPCASSHNDGYWTTGRGYSFETGVCFEDEDFDYSKGYIRPVLHYKK